MDQQCLSSYIWQHKCCENISRNNFSTIVVISKCTSVVLCNTVLKHAFSPVYNHGRLQVAKNYHTWNRAFDNKFKVFWCKIYILTVAVNFMGRLTFYLQETSVFKSRGNFRSWYQWRLALPYLSQFDFSYFMSNYLIVLQYIVKYNKMSVRVGFNCNNMNFIWKNSLFLKISTVAVLKLHFNLYVKFIYNLR